MKTKRKKIDFRRIIVLFVPTKTWKLKNSKLHVQIPSKLYIVQLSPYNFGVWNPSKIFATHSDFNIVRDVFTKKLSAVSNTVKFSSKTNVRGATRSITHALRSLSVSCRMLGLQQAWSRFRIDFFVANLRGPLRSPPLCARVFAKHTSGVLRRNSATKFCGQFARANV